MNRAIRIVVSVLVLLAAGALGGACTWWPSPTEPPFVGGDSLTVQAAITEGALAYDIWASSNWRGGWPTMRVEALAGARYTYLRTKIDAAFTSALGNVRVESDGHEDWVDPFVGGRFSWHPADRCLLSLRTDFGGFTAGADFAWNVNLAVAYKLTNWLTVDGGYRALYTDLDKGDFKYRLWWHGPWMGLGVRF